MVSGAEERWHRRKGGGGVSSSHVHVGGQLTGYMYGGSCPHLSRRGAAGLAYISKRQEFGRKVKLSWFYPFPFPFPPSTTSRYYMYATSISPMRQSTPPDDTLQIRPRWNNWTPFSAAKRERLFNRSHMHSIQTSPVSAMTTRTILSTPLVATSFHIFVRLQIRLPAPLAAIMCTNIILLLS